MVQQLGHREQKKQLTRRRLCDVAIQLFDVQGYSETTVSQIAAAAQVSRATFFNYFRGKEDVLFADEAAHEELIRQVLGDREPGETPEEAMLRTVDSLLGAAGWSIDPASELVSARDRLIATEPDLRARALLRVADLHSHWARSLHEAFSESVDHTQAAAKTGAVIGAVLGAASTHLRNPSGLDSLPQVVRYAATIALGK